MQLLALLAIGGLTASVSARGAHHNDKNRGPSLPHLNVPKSNMHSDKRQSTRIINTEASQCVDFDIGESYAGLLPISKAANETSKLYFWFFPSANPDANDEITIWLNGGPGCSSLEGLLQENGPISWPYGTGVKPVYNPWSWVNLTNMVWIDQPVGTGFSQGVSTATSQEEIAEDFLGFFKNFVDTFGLKNRKVYFTGQSYATRYMSFITDAMLSKNDSTYFDVKGMLMYSPAIGPVVLTSDIPAVAYVDKWAGLFNLNKTLTEDIHKRSKTCGYTDYMNKYLSFPPPSKLPYPEKDGDTDGCNILNDIGFGVVNINPCFNPDTIAMTCPFLYDPLGHPGSVDFLPTGTEIYFNRTDVQAAINAPIQPWDLCTEGILTSDTSPHASYEVLPRVIDALDRTIIAHGDLNYKVLHNGTLLTIQNMTWGGSQGFQKPPVDEFYVPYYDEISLTSLTGSGIIGKTITERKLTYIEQAQAGHGVPRYQPSSAYRHLEFLLGRVKSVTSRESFTTMPKTPQSNDKEH